MVKGIFKLKRKDLILKKLIELSRGNGIDATTLANELNMSRANVSHELNLLCKEGKVVKSEGRPVLFSPVFNNVTTSSNDSKLYELDMLIKNNISLKQAGEQAKAAILYPPKGIHCLILGETGVGKSTFARIMHKYAIDMGVKKPDAPFIAFNCADYSNNPQLLTAQLFGVKKGAYTGADTDKEGLIEKANGGILFLDEVHRLPPEGQEILFTFLDTGYFRRVGDVENRTSDVLIISATTEDPSSALLNTFTRRIPMIIKIPPLRDRTLEERFYLLKRFFKHESIKLNRDIFVSLNSMRAFCSYDCPNNIGQLESDVKLICAKVYSEFLTNKKNDIRICSRDLPDYIKKGLYTDKQHRMLWNEVIGDDIEFFKFSPTSEIEEIPTASNDNSIYEIINDRLRQLKAKGISDIDIESILEKDIAKYFHKQIYGITEEKNKQNLIHILGEDIINITDRIAENVSDHLGKSLSQNSYTALALHLNTLIERVNKNKPIVNPQLSKIKQLYPKEFEVAIEAKKIIEKYLNVSIPEDEAGFITIFLISDKEYINKQNEKVKVIIIAHGNSTATSMADVANKLLGENYAIGLDAHLDKSPLEVLETLKDYVRNDMNQAGYLLLVDMGSLTTFGETIEKEFNVPVKVIPLISTLHVIEATRKALLGMPLNNIYMSVQSINSYMENSMDFAPLISDKKKIAIITACLTGEGASVAIKSFLKNNLKFDKDLFEIIPIDSLDKHITMKKIAEIQENMEIAFIVSSFPLDTNIRQYSMNDVLSLKVIKELQEIVDIKTTLLKMGYVLKENIDNIDGEELYNDIQNTIMKLCNTLSVCFDDDMLLGIILHFAFMVSRIKKGEKSIEFLGKEEYIKNNKSLYNAVKQSLNYLDRKYSIKIPDDEICYVMRFFQEKDALFNVI